MKTTETYTYTFATETITIGADDGVSAAWIAELQEFDRLEYNNDHAQLRRKCSLEAYDPNGKSLDDPHAIDEELNERELLRQIRGMLTAEQWRVFDLYFRQGWSVEETAHAAGVSNGAVYMMCTRIRTKLRKYLQEA